MNENMMNIIAGLDIGNGYVKGKLSVNGAAPMRVDMPSVVTYAKTAIPAVQADDTYIANFDNNMDLTFSSRAIKQVDEGRVYVGNRAISVGTTPKEFDISDTTPKCEDSLSTMLALASITSAAIRSYWAEHRALPVKELVCHVVAAFALPINDYLKYKDRYPQTLMRDEHYVFVKNFEQDVTVRVVFDDVCCMPEGAAGQYAITQLGSAFLDAALNDCRKHGGIIDAAYTGELLATQVKNTIGVDIGEGTVNFPVFMDGMVNTPACKSINSGYGSVLEAVCDQTMDDNLLRCKSRKDLAEFLLRDDLLPQGKHRQDRLRTLVDKQITVFVREVMRTFNRVFADVGSRAEAVYVYGGGASAVRGELYDKLVAAVTGEFGTLPVIYLDSSFSRDLNRNGLFDVASVTANAVWGAK